MDERSLMKIDVILVRPRWIDQERRESTHFALEDGVELVGFHHFVHLDGLRSAALEFDISSLAAFLQPSVMHTDQRKLNGGK